MKHGVRHCRDHETVSKECEWSEKHKDKDDRIKMKITIKNA